MRILINEPNFEKFIYHPYLSIPLTLNGKTLVLMVNRCRTNELKQLPEVLKRIKLVRNFRLNSIAHTKICRNNHLYFVIETDLKHLF